MTISTGLSWSIACCMLGIAYMLMLNLIDKVQAQPVRVQVEGLWLRSWLAWWDLWTRNIGSSLLM